MKVAFIAAGGCWSGCGRGDYAGGVVVVKDGKLGAQRVEAHEMREILRGPPGCAIRFLRGRLDIAPRAVAVDFGEKIGEVRLEGFYVIAGG